MRTDSALKIIALALAFCALAAYAKVREVARPRPVQAVNTGPNVGESNTAVTEDLANSRLFSRIYGCEAAGTIGNSMGDVTEGLSWRKIEERYGLVDRLLSQDKKASRRPQPFGPDWVRHAHHRPPGMTEDGFERHRLCTSAILKKGGSITIEDLARTWIEEIDPNKFGYLMGPQDQVIYNLLKTGLPPWEVGRYAAWPSFIGTSKMIMPIGMVNACRPDQAAKDALALGRIKDVKGRPGNYALEVCAAIAAATAEALRPGATVESVIEAALAQLPPVPLKEVKQGLGWARKAKDWKELRPLYEKRYEGKRISNAVEVLSGGLACFFMADGQPREAIIYAVNLGRDTDCKAYLAGGLAGALRGIEVIPPQWVKTVEEEVVHDPYTVSRRTARQAAEGLYQACIAEMRKSKKAVSEIESMMGRQE
ncbi:MAG: ADP-ribosylglycohydrolase family protein [Planctomycetota bacterium]|jgi:ADP-ribosylglycohydrolase